MHNTVFNILPTRVYTYWQIGIHTGTLAILLCLPIAALQKLLFCTLTAVSFIYYQYQTKRKAYSIISLAHAAKDEWYLYTDRGEKWTVQLLKQNYLSDFLLILRFKGIAHAQKLAPLFLLPQQLSEQDWRHLQMLLRGQPRD